MSYAKGANCLEDICIHRITYDFLRSLKVMKRKFSTHRECEKLICSNYIVEFRELPTCVSQFI